MTCKTMLSGHHSKTCAVPNVELDESDKTHIGTTSKELTNFFLDITNLMGSYTCSANA